MEGGRRQGLSGGVVELFSGASTARISSHGAELTGWSVAGSELMWTPQAQFWDRVSPILFPVVGWCKDARIRIGDRYYPMPVHGFAANYGFAVTARASDFVKFVLRDNEQTRAHYPFAFELSVAYRLREAELEIELEILNSGQEPMPYACGLHPGFRWPFGDGAKADYSLIFGSKERRDVPEIAPGGLFSTQMRAIAFDGVTLPLDEELFAREALCFLNVRSHSVCFASPGGPYIKAQFDGFPHLALWSRRDAPFLCIEAWTGHGDPVGYEGQLSAKPSMIQLEPGSSRRHRAVFSFCA